MVKVLGIVSGKGGVGKTTIAINLGLVLNNHGRKVVVVDGDLQKPDLGLNLGVSLEALKKHSIHSAISEGKGLDQLVFIHDSGLKFIPGDPNISGFSKIEKSILEDMKSSELVILDNPPGFGKDAKEAIGICDAVIVVVTPDVPAVQAAMKTIKMAKLVLGVVVNRARAGSLSPQEISGLLELPVLATIPDDKRFGLGAPHPVVFMYPESELASGYKELAGHILGEKYVAIQEKKESTFNKILRKLGLVIPGH